MGNPLRVLVAENHPDLSEAVARIVDTEPLVRLNVESRGNDALMREKTQELLALLDP
jgi:phosphomannomutase